MSLAENIKRIRLVCGMDQLHFGLALGVNPQTVSKWERGKLKPNSARKRQMRRMEEEAVQAAGEIIHVDVDGGNVEGGEVEGGSDNGGEVERVEGQDNTL